MAAQLAARRPSRPARSRKGTRMTCILTRACAIGTIGPPWDKKHATQAAPRVVAARAPPQRAARRPGGAPAPRAQFAGSGSGSSGTGGARSGGGSKGSSGGGATVRTSARAPQVPQVALRSSGSTRSSSSSIGVGGQKPPAAADRHHHHHQQQQQPEQQQQQPEQKQQPSNALELLMQSLDLEGGAPRAAGGGAGADGGPTASADGGAAAAGSSKAQAAAAVVGLLGGAALLLGGGYVFREPIRHFLEFFIDAVDEWGAWGYVCYAAVYTGLEVRQAQGGREGGRGDAMARACLEGWEWARRGEEGRRRRRLFSRALQPVAFPHLRSYLTLALLSFSPTTKRTNK